ncbi:MAG: hypothetical protein KatS3mg123_1538 [Burkholderiales bacterium]|nr:MAG: hypothetical protein KatS3mg123_1538 [Burkholderiales bacterium]
MTEQEFDNLAARGYNRVPVVLETLADLDTPLSLYLKLAGEPYSYLLESVIGGERFGRYSIIGLPAELRIEVKGHRVGLVRRGLAVEEHETPDPLGFLQAYLARFRAAPLAAAPASAAGSWATSATTRCATSSRG